MPTLRIWPSTNGGSVTADNATTDLATEFYVTSPANITGYYWWCPTGGDTAAITFRLYSTTNGTSGTLVTGSTVTSGTLTANAWNFTALTPVLLSANTRYRATATYTGASNHYGATVNYFTAGGGGASDIVNGILVCPTGANALNGSQGSFNEPSTASFPATGSGNHASYWVDVQITTIDQTSPPTQQGGRRYRQRFRRKQQAPTIVPVIPATISGTVASITAAAGPSTTTYVFPAIPGAAVPGAMEPGNIQANSSIAAGTTVSVPGAGSVTGNIGFRTAGTAGTGTTSLSLTIPASAQVGDMLIMSVVSSSATAVSSAVTATGWTQRDTALDTGGTPTPTITVLWRKCIASDPGSSVPLTFANAVTTCVGVINAYSGVDTTTPFESSSATFDATAGAATHTTPSITTALDSDWIITAFGDRSGSTWTPPAGFTERSDNASGAVSSLETADSNGTIAHGTISEVGTGSVSTSTAVMWIGALKAAPVASQVATLSASAIAGTTTITGGTTVTGVTATANINAVAGSIPATLSGAVATASINATAGSIPKTLSGAVAAASISAIAGTVSTGAGSPVASASINSQAGTVSTGVGSPVASSTINAIAGAVQSSGTVVSGVVASASINAIAGTFSSAIGGAVAAATITAPSGTVQETLPGAVASASITAPAGSIPSTITGAVATATISAIAGTVTAGSGTTVSGVPATASITSVAGAISGAAVTGAAGTINAVAVAGTVAGGVQVNGVVASASISAVIGTISAGNTISGVTAPASINAAPGTVQFSNTIAGVTGTINAVAISGAIGTGKIVAGVPATAGIVAVAGTISAGNTITGVTATATFRAIAGTVSAGNTITGVVASITVTAPSGTVFTGVLVSFGTSTAGGKEYGSTAGTGQLTDSIVGSIVGE